MASSLGSKNPSATFFWNDWDNDEALKACSLAAQGLWMRMLCIAARSSEQGVVMIGGFPAGRAEIEPRIAVVVGQPPATVSTLIDELLTSGAADLDRKGRIINRRMVKAAALHKKRSDAGKSGADVTNGKNKRKEDLPRQTSGKEVGGPPANSPANGAPSSRLQDSPLQSSVTTTPSVANSARGRASQPGRVTLIADDWMPSEAAIAQLRKGRPDLTGAFFEQRMIDFRLWCRDKAVMSHDPEAAWLGFMRKSQAAPTANSSDDIEAALERSRRFGK